MSEITPQPVYDVALLEYCARVTGPPAVLDHLAGLLPKPPLWTVSSPNEQECFHVRPDSPVAGWLQVLRDDDALLTTETRDEALSYLLWSIYTRAVERLSGRYLLFHAGAVGLGGRGVLLPAASGSGKSTLVAGLMAAGLEYISDDVVPVDATSLRMSPFSKSVGVKRGSLRPLASVHPRLARDAPHLSAFGETVWHLLPPVDSWPAGPATVDYVVVPRYIKGARTTLTPVARSAALMSLLDQSFNVRAHGGYGIARTVEMVRQADCYALTFGRLHEAVAAVADLISR
jgi:hypothetical protein